MTISPGIARHVRDLDGVSIPSTELVEQGQRIVIVAEAHGLAGAERVQRAEDGGVAKALGDAARVEGVQLVGLEVQMAGC